MRASRAVILPTLVLLLATACGSRGPRRVEPEEVVRMLAAPVATMQAATPLAISGERAYVERWTQSSDGGEFEIVWTRADELPVEVRARFAER